MQIGNLKKGLNPLSGSDLIFTSPYMATAVKTGLITGIIALAVSPYSLFCFSSKLFTKKMNKFESQKIKR